MIRLLANIFLAGSILNALNTVSFGQESMIAFASNVTGDYEIYVIKPDGTGLQRLTYSEGNDEPMSWSPDGSKIAFQSDRNGKYDIYIMNADGTGQKKLIGTDNQNVSPSWSHDEKKIAFTSGNYHFGTLHVIDFDGTNLRTIPVDNHEVTRPVWSPDNTRIVISASSTPVLDNQKWGIYIIDLNGKIITRLTEEHSYAINAVWSPDGSKIAYVTNRDYPNGDFDGVAGNWEIYVMNADGKGKKRLTNNSSTDNFPSWSPDGSKIAFYSRRNGHFSEIYIMNADGTNQKRLTNFQNLNNVNSWPPKSSRSVLRGEKDIMIIDEKKSGNDPKMTSSSDSYVPIWSPIIKK